MTSSIYPLIIHSFIHPSLIHMMSLMPGGYSEDKILTLQALYEQRKQDLATKSMMSPQFPKRDG